MLAQDYIRLVKRKYSKLALLKFYDEISVYLHKGMPYQCVFRINDYQVRHHDKVFKYVGEGDRVGKYVFIYDPAQIKITDELANKLDDIILVFDMHTQVIQVLPSNESVWKARQAMSDK